MEIRLAGSVGAGGDNRNAEVRAIQIGLNHWRRTQVLPMIGVDGVVGGETIGAIRQFQTAQFGWRDPDGRFDPQGNSLKNLNAFLIGPTRRLLEPVQRFQRGVLAIEMGDDGEIVVRPGDWPSRYALAIYGDPFLFGTFVRIKGDVVSLVAGPGAGPLRIGESIYEYAQLLRFAKRMNTPPPRKPPPLPPIPKTEREKIVERILREDYDIKGEQGKFLADILSKVGIAGPIADVIDVAASLLSKSHLFEAIATVTGIAGLFIGFADSCITLVNLSNTHAKFAAYRGLVYAQAAWAEGAPRPPMSATLRANMRGLSAYDRNAAETEWNRVVAAVYAKLDAEFRTPDEKKVARAALLARFGNSPRELSRAGLQAFEDRFEPGVQRDVWKRGYLFLYKE